MQLQLGDRVTVVGSESAIANGEVLGQLAQAIERAQPDLHLYRDRAGVLIGSIPLQSGIPQPVKLGLAGGPLIVAILISKFGPKYKLVTYTTMSANLMLAIGIAIFLACVGLGAGKLRGYGGQRAVWIGYGAIITVVPLLIMGIIGRKACKLNYYTLMGTIAGSMTDHPRWHSRTLRQETMCRQ